MKLLENPIAELWNKLVVIARSRELRDRQISVIRSMESMVRFRSNNIVTHC